jgi:hypothetical protein
MDDGGVHVCVTEEAEQLFNLSLQRIFNTETEHLNSIP